MIFSSISRWFDQNLVGIISCHIMSLWFTSYPMPSSLSPHALSSCIFSLFMLGKPRFFASPPLNPLPQLPRTSLRIGAKGPRCRGWRHRTCRPIRALVHWVHDRIFPHVDYPINGFRHMFEHVWTMVIMVIKLPHLWHLKKSCFIMFLFHKAWSGRAIAFASPRLYQ